MKIYPITDFSGGVRSGHKRAQNECSVMQNIWCQGINMRPMKSSALFSQSDNAHSTDSMTAFNNHYRYIASDGTVYIVARRNKTIWLGKCDTADWRNTSIVSWYPLLGDVWFNDNYLHKARSASSREQFAQVGSLLYMASEEPNDDDKLMRYDGFYLATGKLRYIGVDSSGRGIYAKYTAAGVADNTYDFESAGVKCGDVLYLKDHSEDTADGGQWRVGTDNATYGYVIDGIHDGSGGSVGEPTGTENVDWGKVEYIFKENTAPIYRATLEDIYADPSLGDAVFHFTGGNWVRIGDTHVTNVSGINGDLAKITYVDGGTYTYCIAYSTNGTYSSGTIFQIYWFATELARDAYWTLLITGGTTTWNGKGRLYVKTANSTYCFDTTDQGEVGTEDLVDYVIVRLREAGIAAGTGCNASQTADGAATLATGTYVYKWRYKDSVTGYTGNVSPASSAVSVVLNTHSVTISGWDNPPDEPFDTLQIFRAETSGIDNLYYLVNEVVRTATYGWNYFDLFGATGVDNGWVVKTDSAGNEIVLETDSVYRDRPGAVRGIKLFNNHLYCAGYDDEAHILKFSTLDDYEYFPVLDWGYTSTTPANAIVGGTVAIGANRNEPIMAIISEGGSYQTTGVSGDNLLIFTSMNAVRWYGYDWTDFQPVAAFSVGCVASNSAINCGGLIIWASQNHIMALASGGNIPGIISSKLFPVGIYGDITASVPLTTMKNWSASYWNGCYMLALTLSGTANDTIWIYDVGGQRWFELDLDCSDLQVWDNPGSDDRLILTAASSVLDTDGDSAIYNVFEGSSAVSCVYESGGLYDKLSAVTGKAYNIRGVRVYCRGGSIPTTLTAMIYDSVDSTARKSYVQSYEATSATERGYIYKDFPLECSCVDPSIRLEFDAMSGFRVERVDLIFEEREVSWNQIR